MAIWKLETDTDFTSFYFTRNEDQEYFHELVKNFFDELKPIKPYWKTFFMLRGEPKKHPDFFDIEETGIIAMSQKVVDLISPALNDAIELLPIETDAGKYYVMNVLNFVDCLKKNESVYQAAAANIISEYTTLELDAEKLMDHAIFKIPELPYTVFISNIILDYCEEHQLEGLVFDEESNLIWAPNG
jgi:hypothetical protein